MNVNPKPFAETFQTIPNLMEKIFSAAHTDSVWSTPITVDRYTVIFASEVSAGGGFGGGIGTADMPAKVEGETSHAENAATGGGIGGGGGSFARPVAAIIISPEGVRVEPIVDVTKFLVSFLSFAGAMMGLVSRLRPMKMRGMVRDLAKGKV